jgi:hypothetical protein
MTWSCGVPEEKLDVARSRIQTALNTLQKWAETWLVAVITTKTAYTIFSLSTNHQKTRLTQNGKPLQQEQSPTCLGVTFDRRMTWRNHIEQATIRAKRRLSLMKRLSSRQWGNTEPYNIPKCPMLMQEESRSTVDSSSLQYKGKCKGRPLSQGRGP